MLSLCRSILMSSYSWMFSKENKTQLLHFMLICLAILKAGCKMCLIGVVVFWCIVGKTIPRISGMSPSRGSSDCDSGHTKNQHLISKYPWVSLFRCLFFFFFCFGKKELVILYFCTTVFLQSSKNHTQKFSQHSGRSFLSLSSLP